MRLAPAHTNMVLESTRRARSSAAAHFGTSRSCTAGMSNDDGEQHKAVDAPIVNKRPARCCKKVLTSFTADCLLRLTCSHGGVSPSSGTTACTGEDKSKGLITHRAISTSQATESCRRTVEGHSLGHLFLTSDHHHRASGQQRSGTSTVF